MRFKDQIVVITGSSRGIGKELAYSFAKEGAVVAIIGRNQESVQNTCHQFLEENLKAEPFVGDVTNLNFIKEIVDKILDKHKRIDILINNAGITRDNLLLRMSETDWDNVICTNLKSVFLTTKLISKVMLKQKQGKIINISSIIGIIGNTGQANYSASKAGIIGFTKSIAKEFASRGITANAIAPGYIQTDMTEDMDDKARDKIISEIPLGTLGTTHDIANLAKFLASQEANYITGQTIVVDGGLGI